MLGSGDVMMQHFVQCKMFYFYPVCLLSKVTLMLLMLAAGLFGITDLCHSCN